MIGKILFIDDECISLSAKTDTRHIINNTIQNAIDAGKLTKDQCILAKNFKDAVEKIVAVKNGRDYAWIFIDRNLGDFSDINNINNGNTTEINISNINDTIKLKGAFFDTLKGFEGDYLYFLLRKAGVPLEKICFLTANDPNNEGENSSLKTSHLIFSDELPNVITKGISEGRKSCQYTGNDDDDNEQQSNDEEKLYKYITESIEVQISFRYRDFFKNEHVEDILGDDLLNKNFKNLLIKIENGENPEPADGIVLRNMIEAVVVYITKTDETTVRYFLNNTPAYCSLLKQFYTPQNVLDYYTKTQKLPEKGDEQDIKDFLNTDTHCPKTQICNEVEAMIKYATAIQIQILKKEQNTPIPKYIYSYIDNIYTVTSEWSAHGKNNKTTKGLTIEGWKALTYGMIQILQWVATWKKCQNCQGSGQVQCKTCHGTGYTW